MSAVYKASFCKILNITKFSILINRELSEDKICKALIFIKNLLFRLDPLIILLKSYHNLKLQSLFIYPTYNSICYLFPIFFQHHSMSHALKNINFCLVSFCHSFNFFGTYYYIICSPQH